MKLLIIMFIWTGGIQNGSLATVTGFETLDACNKSIPIVRSTRAVGSSSYVDCRALPAKD